jgi:hypothetical protein
MPSLRRAGGISSIRFNGISLGGAGELPDMSQTLRMVAAPYDFPEIVGFRVLDERDLMEFWPECSSPHGKLFEILAGAGRAASDQDASAVDDGETSRAMCLALLISAMRKSSAVCKFSHEGASPPR